MCRELHPNNKWMGVVLQSWPLGSHAHRELLLNDLPTVYWLLQGFRRYQTIRDTLCHELAHNVWGEHDDRFKTLNSQIRNHVDRISGSSGQRMFQRYTVHLSHRQGFLYPPPPNSPGGALAILAGDFLRFVLLCSLCVL